MLGSHSVHCADSHCNRQVLLASAQQSQMAHERHSEGNPSPLTFPKGKLLLFGLVTLTHNFLQEGKVVCSYPF